MLHPGGTNTLWGAGHRHAGTRVDDWDGVANPSRSWLMKFERSRLTLVGRHVWNGVGVEGEVRVWRYLVGLGAGFWGPT